MEEMHKEIRRIRGIPKEVLVYSASGETAFERIKRLLKENKR